MDHFWADKTLNSQDLKHINHCRLHLNVTRLSDVTTPDGCHIVPEMLNGEITLENLQQIRSSTLKWPRQQKLSKEVWKIWKSAILRHFCNNQGTLLNRLGQ